MSEKLKSVYENQADIPEQYSGLFEERQGKHILVHIEGIDSQGNVHRLEVANAKLRGELSETKTKLTAFGDRKPDAYDTLQHELDETKAALEVAGKPDEEKLNALLETRIKGRLLPLERELTTTKELLGTMTGERDTLHQAGEIRHIRDAIRVKGGKIIEPDMMEDVLQLTERLFERVDSDGTGKNMRIHTRDNVGVTPGLDVETYFKEMIQVKPLWFAGNTSAGSKGGKNGTFVGDNPWSAEKWNLTAQGKVVQEKGMDEAQHMAKAAGSHVGAARPTVKKTV